MIVEVQHVWYSFVTVGNGPDVKVENPFWVCKAIRIMIGIEVKRGLVGVSMMWLCMSSIGAAVNR